MAAAFTRRAEATVKFGIPCSLHAASAGEWSVSRSIRPHGNSRPGLLEGNAWNYGLYVPHAPDSLIAWHGNSKPSQLTWTLFTELTTPLCPHRGHFTDGIIGNYAHGNEPAIT